MFRPGDHNFLAAAAKRTLTLALVFFLPVQIAADPFKIESLNRTGSLAWINAFVPGVCTIERASSATGPWMPVENVFATTATGTAQVSAFSPQEFYRLLSVDVSPTPAGYANLLSSFGLISTVAGKGEFGGDGMNNWLPEYEGGLATDADLSRPHFAMADDAGNIYIVDKDSHSVLKVTSRGTIHTVAGTHEGGFNGDGPAPGTSLQLNFPNGEWVRGDGTVYILDTDNGKVRRLTSQGIMSTLFTVKGGISTGRGLWVRDDESLVYFASGTELKKWTPSGGVKTLNNNFTEIGNLVVDRAGQLIVTDRGAHKVYRVDTSGNNAGNRTKIAGNGNTDPTVDGALATETGLYGVRAVWPFPTGGYLLGTHEGSQILYLDTAGIIHVFVDGAPGNVHDGDGGYFHSDGPKVSEVRSVTMDKRGNIIICENDNGFIRFISFLRLEP
jgi:hypothetical protein